MMIGLGSGRDCLDSDLPFPCAGAAEGLLVGEDDATRLPCSDVVRARARSSACDDGRGWVISSNTTDAVGVGAGDRKVTFLTPSPLVLTVLPRIPRPPSSSMTAMGSKVSPSPSPSSSPLGDRGRVESEEEDDD